jgi:hypothetical protein
MKVSCDQWSTAMGDNCRPQEQGEEGRRHDNGLEKEQNSKVLNSHAGQSRLEDPVEEEGQQTG